MSESASKSIRLRSALVFFIALGLGTLLIFFLAAKITKEKKYLALQRAGAETTILANHLNQSISLTYTLDTLLREKDFAVDQGDLDRFATVLLRNHPYVSNLQYSPKGIVTYISPMAGNERAVGHNLLQDKKRNKEAFDAIEKRILTVAGPFELIQGGFALVARLPVFTGEDQAFWGFTAVLVKMEDLMRSTTIDTLTKRGYAWSLSRIHPDTQQPHIFYGNSDQLPDDAVQLTMQAPNATWHINIKPKEGWLAGAYWIIILSSAIVFTLALLFAYITYLVLREPLLMRDKVERRTRELRASQEKLAKSENRLAQVAENSEMWIWEVDAKGLYTYCSDACERLFGFPANEVVGKKYFYDFFHPNIRDERKAQAFDLFSRKAPFKEFVNQNINQAGESVWLSTSGVPILDPSGKLLGYRGADIDITEQRRLIEEQKRTAQWVAVGRLAANMAHEINNPAQAIVSFAELIKEKPDDQRFILDIAERILKEGMKIGGLTKTTLHYSKPKGKERTLESIKDLVNNVSPLTKNKLNKEEINLQVELAEDLPKLFINGSEIEQCLINLLNNAIDALVDAGNGTRSRLIDIYAQVDKAEGFLHLSIKDNGPGIPQQDIDKVKNAFFSTKPTDQGTGLGLAIVDDIMRNHGGSLNIESRQGHYAKFTLSFPLPA